MKKLSAINCSVFVFQEFLFKRVIIHFVGRHIFRSSAWLALQFAEQMFQRMVQLDRCTVDRLFQGIGFMQYRKRLMALWPCFQAAA